MRKRRTRRSYAVPSQSAGLSPITIAGVGPATDVSSPDADEREAGAASLRRYVDFTVALGGDQMNGVPYGLFGHPAGPTSREAFERSAARGGRGSPTTRTSRA